MVLGRVSFLLRWSRPFPPLARMTTVIDDSRGTWSSTGSNSSTSSTSSKRQLGEQRRNLCSGNGNSNGNEFIATLGVFFTLPEQGVTSPEILSRFDRFRVDRSIRWSCRRAHSSFSGTRPIPVSQSTAVSIYGRAQSRHANRPPAHVQSGYRTGAVMLRKWHFVVQWMRDER